MNAHIVGGAPAEGSQPGRVGSPGRHRLAVTGADAPRWPNMANRWILGARPRTLPAAVVPVAVGTAAAVGEGAPLAWWRALAALVVSLALQIATNYANDYSDGIRGTDAARVGPVRLVASGLAPAKAGQGSCLCGVRVSRAWSAWRSPPR